MKQLWLLYEDHDYAVNRDFGEMMHRLGLPLGLDLQPVVTSRLVTGMGANGDPVCFLDGIFARPDAVLSRQRNALLSAHFEKMGIPVFNGSRVCAICNDKRATHLFLNGLPQMEGLFFEGSLPDSIPVTEWPCVVKPACSHGGDRVRLVHNAAEWKEAASAILPDAMLSQKKAGDSGRDLRIYVLNGRILAAVMRTAKDGFLSNFKKGGSVTLHEPTEEERTLAEKVIRRFQEAGAPLYMAGIDLLYDSGHPVIGEVEDVVGSRMLYSVSDIDIAALYLREITEILDHTAE